MVITANKMLKILKKLEPQTSNVNGIYKVKIKYGENTFIGYARLHPEDKEYESELVGFTIAHMRAAKKALIYYRDLTYVNYIICNKMLCDIMQNQDPEVVDPTFKLRSKVYRAKHQWENYQNAIKIMDKTIYKYLKNQNEAIESIKRQRKLQANN